jgi:hypothetical protein
MGKERCGYTGGWIRTRGLRRECVVSWSYLPFLSLGCRCIFIAGPRLSPAGVGGKKQGFGLAAPARGEGGLLGLGFGTGFN